MWLEPTGNRIRSAGICGCTCRLVTQTEGKQQLFSPPDPSWHSHIRLRSTSALLPPSSTQVYFFMTPRLFFWWARVWLQASVQVTRVQMSFVHTNTQKREIGAEIFKIGQIKEEGWRISRRDLKKSGGRWKRQICVERYHTFTPLRALLISCSLFSPNWISESWNIWSIYFPVHQSLYLSTELFGHRSAYLN